MRENVPLPVVGLLIARYYLQIVEVLIVTEVGASLQLPASVGYGSLLNDNHG
jgi:hypothetical protein